MLVVEAVLLGESRPRGLALERCEVHTCRWGVVELSQSERLRFLATSFRDCGISDAGFVFKDCREVTFADCAITGMHDGDGESGSHRLLRLLDRPSDDTVRRRPDGPQVHVVLQEVLFQFGQNVLAVSVLAER